MINNFNEDVVIKKLPNGLSLYLVPKPEFAQTCAILATKFGSLNENILLNDKINVPFGTAHFLEHCLFQVEGADALDLFSSFGANANAFTSYNVTAYYFTIVGQLQKPLQLLLDMVQNINVDSKKVSKEKLIIKEELSMYEDNPNSRIRLQVLDNLYFNHPIKNDIGGTTKTVDKVTLKTLQAVHQTFYHPENMTLIIAGNFDVDEVLKLIELDQQKKKFNARLPIKKFEYDESDTVNKKSSSLKMRVSNYKVSVAIKSIPLDNLSSKEKVEIDWLLNIYLLCVFSKSSKLYESWLESGLIDLSFRFHFAYGDKYAYIIFSTSSNDYLKLIDEIKLVLSSWRKQIKEEDFIRIKNKEISDIILDFDKIDSIALNILFKVIDEIDIFSEIEVLKNINFNDLDKLNPYIDINKLTYSVISSKE